MHIRYWVIVITLYSNAIFAETNIIRVTAEDTQITITMSENPTTGYIWFLTDYNAAFLTPIDRQYTAPSSKLAGAPGTVTWHFKSMVTVPAITQVTFSANRPWSVSQDAPKKTFTVVLDRE